ncbi:class I SAM-dependent methyltransferase [Bradyrhizobium sp. TZ2]
MKLFFAPTVAENLKPGDRVLEVGSGIGFLTSWLHLNGVDIHGLDPASGPFDPFTEMSRAVAERIGPDRPGTFHIGAQELNPEKFGEFDLIFSFNVLEHVQSIDDVFAAMASVLKPGGVMVHCCPNYAVPYEPHLGIPLMPFRPQLTDRVFRKAIRASQDIWDRSTS